MGTGTVPAATVSFRSRGSGSRRTLHLDTAHSTELTNLPTADEDLILGAESDDTAVELLDNVPSSKQLYLCFDNINAYAPSAMPSGGQYANVRLRWAAASCLGFTSADAC